MKVLLIEDEIGIVNFLARGFRADGYDVVHVEEGQQALALMESERFQVIILDLILPAMSGEEILQKIREGGDATPVIVLTSVNDPEIKTRLLNAGADDYLVKPFSFVELAARIRSVLRRSKSQEAESEELAVADLRLNPERRLVTRAGKPIHLRLKEYVLLAYLMKNKDRAISRSTLVEQVWDYNAQLFSNTVDSHICSLRTKLNAGSRPNLIQTIHGVGYILRSKPLPPNSSN